MKTSSRFGQALASDRPSKTVSANCVSSRQTQTTAEVISLHFRSLFRCSIHGYACQAGPPQQTDSTEQYSRVVTSGMLVMPPPISLSH